MSILDPFTHINPIPTPEDTRRILEALGCQSTSAYPIVPHSPEWHFKWQPRPGISVMGFVRSDNIIRYIYEYKPGYWSTLESWCGDISDWVHWVIGENIPPPRI